VKIERLKLATRALWLLALALIWLTALPARAVLEPDGANDAAYQNAAINFGPNLAKVSLLYQGNTYITSGVIISSNWVVTAAHNGYDSQGNPYTTIVGISQGVVPNTLRPIEGTWLYPGYNGSGNTVDLMLVRLSAPVNAPALIFGAATTGSIVTSAGFGSYGTVSGGLNTGDGIARAWQATVDANTYGGYSSSYYQSTDFNYRLNGVSLNGRGANGDSGGPVFNSQGQLVGINIAGGGSPIGSTEYLMLSQPDVYAWIQNTITPVEPQVLSLAREGADVRLVWQGKGGSNYVVQAAATLSGTNAFSDVSASITLPGVGPVTTNFLDAGTLTNRPARFYRIRTN